VICDENARGRDEGLRRQGLGRRGLGVEFLGVPRGSSEFLGVDLDWYSVARGSSDFRSGSRLLLGPPRNSEEPEELRGTEPPVTA
jgi:hypothetical protein